MEKKILVIAILLGGLAIVLGAFGAHALKKYLDASQLNTFEIGVRYQMYHALFLLLVANLNIPNNYKMVIAYLVLIGIILFSGSIYLLATSALTGIKAKFLGPLTPLGGLFLISAWGYLLFVIFRKNQ